MKRIMFITCISILSMVATVSADTGMWSINSYVDNFGDPTEKKFIRNILPIRGTFSNTATQDSALNVIFLINDLHNISIQLYEYAGNNPVKAYSSEKYTVLVKDKCGKHIKVNAANWSDRITFSKRTFGAWITETHSAAVHHILMKGGTIKFVIIENDVPTTTYKFTIRNADGYNEAYRELTKMNDEELATILREIDNGIKWVESRAKELEEWQLLKK